MGRGPKLTPKPKKERFFPPSHCRQDSIKAPCSSCVSLLLWPKSRLPSGHLDQNQSLRYGHTYRTSAILLHLNISWMNQHQSNMFIHHNMLYTTLIHRLHVRVLVPLPPIVCFVTVLKGPEKHKTAAPKEMLAEVAKATWIPSCLGYRLAPEKKKRKKKNIQLKSLRWS